MCRRTIMVIAVSLAIGACGDSKPKQAVAIGCRDRVTRALHAVSATPRAPQDQLTACTYRLPGGAKVLVVNDTAPQVPFRFERTVVETDQNSLWSTTPALAPRLVTSVKFGANWIPAYRQLVATDMHTLLTITVNGDAHHAQALAIAAAGASLRTRSGS